MSTLCKLPLAAVTWVVSFNVEAEDGRAVARQQYGTTTILLLSISQDILPQYQSSYLDLAA